MRRSVSLGLVTTLLLLPLSTFAQTAAGFNIIVPIPPTKGSVTILWQTSGYTPAFYEGKAIRADQNSITFTAIATSDGGAVLSSKNINFLWRQDGTAYADRSGVDQNTFTYDGSGIQKTLNITVTATSDDGSLNASATVVVNRTSPELLLYEDNPLYGVQFQNALSGNVPLDGQEMRLAAIPFFFNATTLNDQKLSYRWSMNGGTIQNTNTSSLLLRQTGSAGGSSNVSVSVTSLQDFMQFASNAATITFSNAPQTSTTF